MINATHKRYINYNSDFMSLTFDRETAKLAFLGVESSGRDRDKHASFNLLLIGKGAVSGGFSSKSTVNTSVSEDTVEFSDGKNVKSSVKIYNEKEFEWTVGGAPKDKLLSFDFSIKTAPLTVWSDSVAERSNKCLKSRNPLCVFKRKYKVPLILHFPDF